MLGYSSDERRLFRHGPRLVTLADEPERVRDGRGVALINFEPFSFSVESAVYFKFDTSLASAKYRSHSEPHANFTPFIVSFKLKTKYLNTL